MVIYFEWHWTAEDPKSSSCLPMTGEDTGLGALASPLAGYLGKVQERASSLENCPWCQKKGLNYALRSYRINLQESITLCTNPQCLFPLVSRPLEDVLASLDPVEPTSGNKRKNPLVLEKEDLIKPPLKWLRSSEHEDFGPEVATNLAGNPVEHDLLNSGTNGQHEGAITEGEKVNGVHMDCSVVGPRIEESLQHTDVPEEDPEDFTRPAHSAGHSSEVVMTPAGDGPVLSPHSDVSRSEVVNCNNSLCSHQFSPNEDVFSDINGSLTREHQSVTQTEQKSLTMDVTTCNGLRGMTPQRENSLELVSVPSQLFWKNRDNLCWLDSLLAALVNFKSLRKCKPKREAQGSSVWQLMREYDNICAAIQVHQHTGRDGIVRVPHHVLQRAETDLHSLRMSVFNLLQPRLHCKLGQKETPVFAMPLLLMLDPSVEHLFQSTFQWDFKCSACKVVMKESAVKTLPSFTHVVPDWHPLHAAHSGPCNVCHTKNQMRTMMLERLSPVFALHFVEGLPNNDVSNYSFSLKGKRYSITTVIQYDHQREHFVTWICNADGSWLEYDDLKYPDCKTHPKLPLPAQEAHVVFWEEEEEEDKEPYACSPSSTFSESKNETIPSLADKDLTADEQQACSPDQSLFIPHNDTDIICALSVPENGIMDSTITADKISDASIGATTLLDTFEGLTHNDIVTLTLVEVEPDSAMQPSNDSQLTQDIQSVPTRKETLNPSPDSSSIVAGEEMCHGPTEELPATSTTSDNELGDGSSSDPTFVPTTRRGRGRGRGRGRNVGRQKGIKAALSDVTSHTSLPVSSEPAKVINDTPVIPPVQHNAPPADAQPVSPVSSSHIAPLSTNKPTTPTPLDQSARWSFLLSKHIHNSVTKTLPTQKPTTVVQVKPTPPPIHSTPIPVKRQQPPVIPQLRTDSEGLPPKAAEMYTAFSAKSSLPPAVLLTDKPKQPVASNYPTNTIVKSSQSFATPGPLGLSEISSSRKHGSLPQALNNTEALRRKLLKKLKAKKKKLAELNRLLGHQGGAGLHPDSTDLASPSTVSSSTYDGSTCNDDFLSDLLSPATTASNLSPDSTGFLEMLASQNGDHQMSSMASSAASQTCNGTEPNPENFLDEFLCQAVAQRPTDMETDMLSALELFS
ncbi:SUMO-specific isopeptidase USPL1 [Parambassis ranga]|uniref:SUMO-specific isopeptidase USPL1 n=1 Tax=Parambassis ranga TaxID=210632 RepID=A0A6P7JLU3_9TELE|nr:SUMO-specific isopeptidase USPL1 [Parambassis ranga]XP_028276565.1 SUMO-specific isopeptidase USPL1 [Parambassis ranga]XP_028276566.1 SUMO-specific isopeptidase USPL1 [Parambassis ranga]XP_028276567.1 SUMO-specific isopeptidase USPL1 [Parambassis ranga]XP_028276568.1 SUMO-specific isopeptidase USPL1 [Parambassis ranga]XP_028276570.1 SUMO-specific isopeptidase USPL1 [Parambassis ranga]